MLLMDIFGLLSHPVMRRSHSFCLNIGLTTTHLTNRVVRRSGVWSGGGGCGGAEKEMRPLLSNAQHTHQRYYHVTVREFASCRCAVDLRATTHGAETCCETRRREHARLSQSPPVVRRLPACAALADRQRRSRAVTGR